jgi:hypothetical protein
VGLGTVVAQLDALSTGTKTESAENGEDRPVEVGIELVQTMAEKAPTLLRGRAAPAQIPTGVKHDTDVQLFADVEIDLRSISSRDRRTSMARSERRRE